MHVMMSLGDGIWDVLTNQAVINFVTEMIGEGKLPEDICEELLGYCLAPVCQMGGLGGDNMSIIIVCFLHGKPYETLVEKCKKFHAEKKATSKLSEPAFNNFDRFTAEGPFAEVSVLKNSDDIHNSNEASSSSPSNSSPSSDLDDKFDALKNEDKVVKVESSDNHKATAVAADSQSEEDVPPPPAEKPAIVVAAEKSVTASEPDSSSKDLQSAGDSVSSSVQETTTTSSDGTSAVSSSSE